MGTRADFYAGRGTEAEWLGSIAWDGYPSGIDDSVLSAADEPTYREQVAAFLTREDGTLPEQGWPWPWDDSNTTDYAYAFEDGKVHCCCFGGPWFDPSGEEPEGGSGHQAFPDMATRRNMPRDSKHSGVIIIGQGGVSA